MFLVSGLLHEMAISLPVGRGYGGPLGYFVLHGGLVLAEEGLAAKGRPVTGIFGRFWTLAWLVLPLPILFHRAFVSEVLLPLVA